MDSAWRRLLTDRLCSSSSAEASAALRWVDEGKDRSRSIFHSGGYFSLRGEHVVRSTDYGRFVPSSRRGPYIVLTDGDLAITERLAVKGADARPIPGMPAPSRAKTSRLTSAIWGEVVMRRHRQ